MQKTIFVKQLKNRHEGSKLFLKQEAFMKTYLFDFDGTLVDSMPAFSKTMLGILDRNGILYGPDLIRNITPLGVVESARYFIGLGVKKSERELIEEMAKELLSAYVHSIPAKENVKETLEDLKKRGYSLNVLTASPHISLDPCLKRLGLWSLFDNVWSCDDFSTSKSDPELYRKVADELGNKPEEILFLDDNYHANETAKRAGMITCGVFDESSAEAEEDLRALCHYYVRDFSEILKLK